MMRVVRNVQKHRLDPAWQQAQLGPSLPSPSVPLTLPAASAHTRPRLGQPIGACSWVAGRLLGTLVDVAASVGCCDQLARSSRQPPSLALFPEGLVDPTGRLPARHQPLLLPLALPFSPNATLTCASRLSAFLSPARAAGAACPRAASAPNQAVRPDGGDGRLCLVLVVLLVLLAVGPLLRPDGLFGPASGSVGRLPPPPPLAVPPARRPGLV